MKTLLPFFLIFALLSGSVTITKAAVIVPVSIHGEPDSATVSVAVNEFYSLSKKDRKARIKEVKKEVRKFRAAKKAGKTEDTQTLLLVILAILLPPLAVYFYEGEINNRFWISLILTLLGWLPGIIYALILILGEK